MRTAAAVAMLLMLASAARAQDISPVVAEGVVAAPVGEVWRAWTTTDGLRSWLTPRADIDLRAGGLMRTNYREHEVLGDPGTIVYTIEEFQPERMLSLRITRPPQNFAFPGAVGAMSIVLYFEPIDELLSRIRIVSVGFATDEESQRMRAFFQAGNAITLEQLQIHFRAVRQGLLR